MARKAPTSSTYRQVGTYQRLCKQLFELPDDGRLDKQLSYWVLPTDRRLPIAFLDRDLRTLLEVPFEQLIKTPGVGQKKIEGLFTLIRRAIKADVCNTPFGMDERHATGTDLGTGFDPTAVSESLWASWCESVRRHEFVDYKLGQLAPSLQMLPTVIWHKSLGEYVDKSLAEIRRMRTHGEKRLHAILEVFCTVHEAVSTSTPSHTLDLQLVPRFVPPVVDWLTSVLDLPKPPTLPEVRRNLVTPLLTQIRTDLGEQVADLASERLQTDGNTPTVKQQAERLGVTRARVYQLLEDCSKVMEVRWPTGRWLLIPLEARAVDASPRAQQLVRAACELFYPRSTSASQTLATS
ncbi:hypothetical protein [Aeoliella mucimassa]|uniref:Uncharacterized protein n=1 Tax=Aeoliella mucimassa TaxID=2527972 RepID=A0A518AIN2_9BACT|nr:hypothetical protein [Aeoliella mucimassa]QDU54560.1 hypothetical protein Pan181_07430 [Aeoliella mucimassa]